ncbi:galactosyltransferase-related protein [Streptomyces sp. NPDC052396]|uniref:galactosyltransferase-related protein n=1 Tax=Streptomyces sp. NPDC052396 TaxID=3365689 RepID=UPI0037CFD711
MHGPRGTDARKLAERLTAHAVLAHDPAVPQIAADYWELSEAHYRAVDALLTGFLHGRPEARPLYTALVTDTADLAPQHALRDRLTGLLEDASGEERAELSAAVAEADRHIWIDYHLGAGHRGGLAGGGLPEDGLPGGGDGPVADFGRRGRADAQVHVVIPFRDREGGGLRTRNLLACLRSLADQEAGAAPWVTVVETDEVPRSRELLAPLVDSYVFAEKSGLFNKSWAVNVGVAGAPHPFPYTCVLDADILVDRSFVRRNTGRIAGGGHGTHLPFRWSLSLDESSTLGALRIRAEHADVPYEALRGLLLREPPGGCVWTRTEIFDKVGGFDERYEGWGGEDDDVIARLSGAAPVVRFEDPLLHLNHPRPQMTREGQPFNAHIEPLSWAPERYGDPLKFTASRA